MRKLVCLALALAGCSAPANAAPPKLLVVISVDQLSADLFDEYRPSFTGGLARIASGTVFRNGFQSHAASETCPGHSTILTGARPARTGIVANLWIDPASVRGDKSIYCAEDERVPGSTSLAYTVSPRHLKVPTLGELLKAQSPGSRVVAVAGKDRAAVMMSGQRPDQRWYWSGQGFVTDLAGVAVPLSVAPTNLAVGAMLAETQTALAAPPLCAAKARPIAVAGRTLGNGAFARAGGDANAFRASPAFDGAVLALAAALTQELKLGRSAAPDLLAIGLSATDYVGHTYGSGGQEMCLQLTSLDRDLGDFLDLLDAQGIDYAVALTADHGGLDLPERLVATVPGAARVDPALAASAVGKAIGAKLGLAGPVLLGDFAGDVWFERALKPADRARVEQAALATYRAHPQVEAVFTKAQIAATAIATSSPDKWTLAERLRASFDPQRSGDLLVVLRPHITPIPEASQQFVATHGSPWDYDRRVPILLWRPNALPAPRAEAIETVDMMPTLAALIGVRIDPASIDGKCLTGVAGIACPPR